MREWTEIVVDEDLIIPVVKELLALAINPNHVEVVYGTTGRVILADVDLAEEWYQSTLKSKSDSAQPEEPAEESVEQTAEESEPTVVVASGFQVVATAKVDTATIPQGTDDLVPTPAKRGPGRPRKSDSTSASNGEDS
jgi:hypothetical protein